MINMLNCFLKCLIQAAGLVSQRLPGRLRVDKGFCYLQGSKIAWIETGFPAKQ